MKSSAARKEKIMVIEDSKLISRMLIEGLMNEGFEVVASATAREGLIQIKKIQPDMIILDLILPDMPGEEVCREIKKDEQLGSVPVIMLTAKASDVDRVIGKVIGADKYITKPFTMENIILNVKTLLQKKKWFSLKNKKLKLPRPIIPESLYPRRSR